MAPPLITVGHGRLTREELGELLATAGIELLVDVRSFPGSRHSDAGARGHVEEACEAAGIAYRWEGRLGGRRHRTKEEDACSPDTWWKVAAFRHYAAWTRTEDFRAGLDELLADIARTRTAILCSETVWWRCHRRIIADVVMLEHGVAVEHLMPAGRLTEASPSTGARVDEDGRVVWDGAQES